MAKRPEGRGGTSTGSKVEAFAEDLGRLLGAARVKVERWLGQRQVITKHLEEVRDTATNLLSQMTGGGTAGRKRRRRAHSQGVRTSRRGGGPVRKKRTMSAEARARIAAGQKARWAKVRAEKRR
jgi:hypothetical protein